MPTVEPPRQQAPMEAALTSSASAPGRTSAEIITQQPKSEPRPQPENDLHLRGGSMTIGCNCCGGSLSCHRVCCR
ncbi:uncharacterized protein B0T15DRAFT_496256 [Chaetomium strumarium]|uniref:Uncharacterized protein n=1 Tax=Chaetomium strumarium TaxID=1170767 RepID=A0AAJ0LZT1_9PEZI|nr:hypothetical protein B0T15DRAFT_496256 [Chaetomium strumarium]